MIVFSVFSVLKRSKFQTSYRLAARDTIRLGKRHPIPLSYIREFLIRRGKTSNEESQYHRVV